MSSYVTFFWSAGAVVPCGTAKNTTLCGFGRDFVIPSHVIPSWPVWVRGTDCFVVLNSSQPHLSDGPSESLSSQVDLLSHAVKLNHAHYYWFLEAASWVALGCVSQLCWFYVVGYICDKRKFCSNPKSQWFPKAGHPQFVTAHMCWTQTWQLELLPSWSIFFMSNETIELCLVPAILSEDGLFHFSFGYPKNDSYWIWYK